MVVALVDHKVVAHLKVAGTLKAVAGTHKVAVDHKVVDRAVAILVKEVGEGPSMDRRLLLVVAVGQPPRTTTCLFRAFSGSGRQPAVLNASCTLRIAISIRAKSVSHE